MRRLLATIIALLLGISPASAQDTEVHIVPGSDINLVARDARIPITINNPTLDPVTVTVQAVATSFRLEVLGSQELTIPPQSSAIAELGVRAVANGPVQVRVWLEANGKQLGENYLLRVNVNYDVELFLLVSFAAVMVALIVTGVIRTTGRLRRGGVD